MKKKQKMKGKTLNLNEFLADDSGTSGPGSSYVLAAKPLSWGEQMDNQEIEGMVVWLIFLINVFDCVKSITATFWITKCVCVV